MKEQETDLMDREREMTLNEYLNSERIEQAYRLVDAKDAGAFSRLFEGNGAFRFGNAPPIRGIDAIEASVKEFFQGIEKIEHRLEQIWVQGVDAATHGQVRYELKNVKSVELPFATVFRLTDNNLFLEWKIFVDLQPLLEVKFH